MKQRCLAICVGFYALSLNSFLSAQPLADSIELPETEVHALRFSCGHLRWSPDSTLSLSGMTVTDQLAFDQAMPLRTNGPQALALPVLRGLPASHMAVLWNGINLQSSMNALLDLQLLNNHRGSMVLESGGNSMLYGSGSVSGVLSLESSLRDSQPMLETLLRYGSFRNSFGRLYWRHHLGLTRFDVSLTRREGLNNMPYINPYRLAQPVWERLEHAHALSQGLQLNIARPFRKGIILESSVWMQQDQRQLPPTMLQVHNSAEQDDQNIRASLIARQELKKWQWVGRLAWLDEQIMYRDLPKSILDTNRCKSFVARWEMEAKPAHQHRFSAIAQAQHSIADVSGYGGRIADQRGYVTLMYEISPKNWSLKAGNQVQYGNQRVQWFLPGVYLTHLRQKVDRLWRFTLNTTLNYRLPTLNDRFWIPGGNPNLLPEQGLRSEAGIDLLRKGSFYALRMYHYAMQNLIVWLPGSQGYWSPENVTSTWSSGMEISADVLLFEKSRYSLKLPLRLQLNRSLSNAGQGLIDRWLNQQQNIYAPVLSSSAGLNLKSQNLECMWRINYTGARYVSNASTRQLNPFWLMHLSVRYRFKDFIIGSQIQNMLDQSYELIAFYPMPGINGSIFLQYTFKYKNHE